MPITFDDYETAQMSRAAQMIAAGGDSEVTGVCDVCSSVDGLGQIELARMGS